MAAARVREIPRMQIADMEKTVLAHAEVYEYRLYPGLDVDHSPLVDIADVTAQARSLDIELFKRAILDDRHPALLALGYIYEHLSWHVRILICIDYSPLAICCCSGISLSFQ